MRRTRSNRAAANANANANASNDANAIAPVMAGDQPEPTVAAVLAALQTETAANRRNNEALMKANEDLLNVLMTERRAERIENRRARTHSTEEGGSAPHTATASYSPSHQGDEGGDDYDEQSYHTVESSQRTVTDEPRRERVVHHRERRERVMDDDVEQRNLIAFRKHKPPTFVGSDDPKVVTTWLQGMDKIFRVMRCNDLLKLRYSVYMLEEDAHEWWCNTVRPFETQRREVTWTMFEELFHERYFPMDVREAKQGEFERLEQGSMTVDEYVAKFYELVKFANYGEAPPTPAFMAAKFQRGLNEKIKKRMSNTAIRDFPELIT